MARKKLFQGPNGKPVMAVTWPFHDLAILKSVATLLNAKGYDTHAQKIVGTTCFELIIGASVKAVEAVEPEVTQLISPVSNGRLN